MNLSIAQLLELARQLASLGTHCRRCTPPVYWQEHALFGSHDSRLSSLSAQFGVHYDSLQALHSQVAKPFARAAGIMYSRV